MARWALRAPHYLAVEDWEWEYTETDRATGRAKRLKFKVPRYLHPDDPNDVNYPPDIIVAYAKGALPRDIIFSGEPTPDMEPLDEEAQAISASHQPRWNNAMGEGAFPAQGPGGFSDAMLAKFEAALNEVVRKVGIPQAENVSLKGADAELLAKLQAQMEDLMKRNLELEAKMNGLTLGPEPGEPIEDLTEAELTAPPPSALENVRRL